MQQQDYHGQYIYAHKNRFYYQTVINHECRHVTTCKLTCILLVPSNCVFVNGNVANLITIVIKIILTPHALTSPTPLNVPCKNCNNDSIGKVKKPNHPPLLVVSAAAAAEVTAAAASGPPGAASNADDMALTSISARVSEEKKCCNVSTCCGTSCNNKDGSVANESLLLDVVNDGDDDDDD